MAGDVSEKLPAATEDMLAAGFFQGQGLDPEIYEKERTGKVRKGGGVSGQGQGSLPQVSFQWKNHDFLLKTPDLLSGILISY